MIGPDGTQRSLLETAATMFSWQMVYGPRSSYRARAEEWTRGFLGQQPDWSHLRRQRSDARRALMDGPTTEQMFFEAGHRLPVDYVPHAAAWIKKHL